MEELGQLPVGGWGCQRVSGGGGGGNKKDRKCHPLIFLMKFWRRKSWMLLADSKEQLPFKRNLDFFVLM